MSKCILFLLSFSVLLADTKTVAISYFDNTSGLEQYNPLSKGLADMLITDLSNVKSIQIVEREKLENLLKEIDLGDLETENQCPRCGFEFDKPVSCDA